MADRARRQVVRLPQLTKEVEERFLTTIRAGGTIRDAAEYCGIPSSTILEWLEQGLRSQASPASRIYSEFAAQVIEARAVARTAVVGALSSSIPLDSRAVLAWLTRPDPACWGPDRTEALGTAENATPTALKDRVVVITPEQAAAVGLAIVRARRGEVETDMTDRTTLAVESYGPDDDRPSTD